MVIFKSFQKCFYIFYLLGYNSYNPRTNYDIESISLTTKSRIPAIIHLTIAIATAAVGFYYQHFCVDFDETTNSFGIYVLMLSFFTVNLTVCYQTLMQSKHFHELIYQFEFIGMYFKANGMFDEHLTVFRRQFRHRIAVILIDFTVTFIVKYSLLSPRTHIIVQTCLTIQMFMANIANLHMYFFLNLLQHFIGMIPAGAVKDDLKVSVFDENAVVAKFKFYKYVYTKMWEISLIINEIFGWTLLTLLLQNCIEFTYALYWVFLHYYVYSTILYLSN